MSDTFNSLFEIQEQGWNGSMHSAESVLSILFLRFDMTTYLAGITYACWSFNSLFEIRH